MHVKSFVLCYSSAEPRLEFAVDARPPPPPPPPAARAPAPITWLASFSEGYGSTQTAGARQGDVHRPRKATQISQFTCLSIPLPLFLELFGGFAWVPSILPVFHFLLSGLLVLLVFVMELGVTLLMQDFPLGKKDANCTLGCWP